VAENYKQTGRRTNDNQAVDRGFLGTVQVSFCLMRKPGWRTQYSDCTTS